MGRFRPIGLKGQNLKKLLGLKGLSALAKKPALSLALQTRRNVKLQQQLQQLLTQLQ